MAGGTGVRLLCRVADMAADGGGISKTAFVVSALQDTSVTLCKGRVQRAHSLQIVQASGRA
jgi:hypothetical protein